jgi:DNA-directed RNA polymerase subunit omega
LPVTKENLPIRTVSAGAVEDGTEKAARESIEGDAASDPRRKSMARITVEDCLKKVDNRFALIHLAAKRVRQLRKGAEPLVSSKNKDIVVSLREIAAGKIFATHESMEDLRIAEGHPPTLEQLPPPAEPDLLPEERIEPESEPEGNTDV